jgi:hypothetical protein
LIFCLDDLSFGERGVLKSPTITVLGSIYVLKFSCTLRAYKLTIVISSWCIASSICLKCPSLFLLTNLGLLYLL